MLSFQQAIGNSSLASVWQVINAPPASIQPSGFFPTPQYTTIRSETAQAAGGTGETFRWTVPENPSMAESSYWASKGWVGSPYEDELAVSVKQTESRQLAKTVETKDPIGQGLDWALGITTKVATIYDKLSEYWQPREKIVETPRAGYPEGQDVFHTNEISKKGADVIETGKMLWEQVKGLFSIGYPQPTPQPVPTMQHELPVVAGLSLPTIGMILLAVYLLSRR